MNYFDRMTECGQFAGSAGLALVYVAKRLGVDQDRLREAILARRASERPV